MRQLTGIRGSAYGLGLLLSVMAFAQTPDPRGVKVRGSELVEVLGSDTAIPRYHALVIGVNQYQHWQDLRNARGDAEEVATLLAGRYGFSDVTTLYDEQATRSGITLALRRMASALREDDALLIFYAGHGFFDKLLNRGYWVPHEARERVDGEPATMDWFSNNDLRDFIAMSRARHVLVVSDSCFSGSLFRGGAPDLSDKANAWYRRAIAQPSRWGISSGDLELVPDQSVFARQFLNALRFPLRPVFSASDLAGRIKVEVAGSTGTQPLFGRLQVDRDSQFGEFIFLDSGADGSAQPRPPVGGATPGKGMEGERPREPVRTGGLFVETVPAGALVKAGGHDIQRSPYTFRNLPAGPLTVTVELADHDTGTRQVTIPADDFATLTVALKRQQGRVTVESDPPRAEIWIGGQRQGETPRTLTLDTGTHVLTLRRDGYEEKTVTVQVRGGQSVSAGTVTLEKPRFPDLRSSWENSLGMKFASVTGVDGVLFGVWETRVQDFREFVNDRARNSNYDYRKGDEPYVLKSDGWKQRGWEFGWNNPGFSQADTHPVTCVSWEDAQAFCDWLTSKERAEGKIAKNQAYRLPQDWEWSVAVGLNESRSGAPNDKNSKTVDVYPWGSGEKPPARWGNYAGEEVKNADWPSNFGVISGYRDDHARTSPVGQYGAKHGALCDLGGNVWEWCEDFYDGQSGARVLRGGSWSNDYPGSLLSSFRDVSRPGDRGVNGGFRVVLGVSSR